uniref:Uncharacterized protein n=1 Tax=Arundo donax TaxID=35708 RepID=A0A0A8XZH3_ARUDO
MSEGKHMQHTITANPVTHCLPFLDSCLNFLLICYAEVLGTKKRNNSTSKIEDHSKFQNLELPTSQYF